MLHFMEQRPQAGIVGPATLCGEEGDTNLLVQHTGRLPTPWTLVRNALPFVGNSGMNWDVMPGSAPARTGWVCGAILMIRTDLMRRLDGFDARFFLYWEETDLCRRAELSGFENWVVGDAVARHVVAASSGHDALRVGASLARHFYQSRFYYLVKHHGWLAAVAAELGEFALLLVRTLADVVRGRGTARLRARLQAVPLSMPARVSDEH